MKNDQKLAEEVADPLLAETTELLLNNVPLEVVESLETYSIVETSRLSNFLTPVFQEYVNQATATPSPHNPTTRAPACEMCERDWIPLTYHHLIPRQVHAKVLKRQWHEEWRLNSVAWLCRACHSFVHKVASNQELARHWYSVELLMSRDDAQSWTQWVRRLRWKGR